MFGTNFEMHFLLQIILQVDYNFYTQRIHLFPSAIKVSFKLIVFEIVELEYDRGYKNVGNSETSLEVHAFIFMHTILV